MSRRKPVSIEKTAPEEGRPLRRGDIVWIGCDPSVGAEPSKTRTCVVVSNDVANELARTISVAPTRAYTADRAARAFMVDLRKPRSTMEAARVANASAVMTYDKSRVVSRAGRVHPAAMVKLDAALALHLGLKAV